MLSNSPQVLRSSVPNYLSHRYSLWLSRRGNHGTDVFVRPRAGSGLLMPGASGHSGSRDGRREAAVMTVPVMRWGRMRPIGEGPAWGEVVGKASPREERGTWRLPRMQTARADGETAWILAHRVCQPPDIRRRPATTLPSPVSSRKQSQQQRHLCFLCQGANHHHPGGLKQHPLIRSPSCGSGFRLSGTEFPAQASQGGGQVACQAEGSSGDPAEGSAAMFVPVVGRIHLLVAVQPRALFPGWLSAGAQLRS